MIPLRIRPPLPGLLLLTLAAAAQAQVAWTRTALENNSSRAIAFDPVGDRTMLCSASRWNPARGSQTAAWDGQAWRLLAPRTAPPGRIGHALATDTVRRRVLLFGGAGSNDTWEWDGTDWALRHPAATPPARVDHGMAFDPVRGRVVLFGGRDAAPLGDTWEWDGATWHQVQPATSPPARFDHRLAWDPVRQQILLFGGLDATFTALGDTWSWDGSTWTRIQSATAPTARYGHGLSQDPGRGRVLLVGGIGPGVLFDLWRWDGTDWARLPGTFPANTVGHDLAADSRRGLLVDLPGETPDSFYVRDSATYEWDGASWRQASPGTSPPSRFAHAMTYDSVRDRVVLFGGTENIAPALYGDTWEWDGSVWHAMGQQLGARAGAALGFDPLRARTVLLGAAFLQPVETWEWDGSQWTQRFPPQQPGGLQNLAFDASVSRLVGMAGSQLWEWDGATWQQRPSAHQPRNQAAVAYDTRRQRLVAHDLLAQETWEWIGQDWVLRVPRTVPVASYYAPFLHDARRNRTVLIVDDSNDVWEWDGTDWTQRTAGTLRPSRRTAAAYDSRRGRVVLFGGDYAGPLTSGDANGDTWEYGPVQPADWTAFGQGCAGSGGTPTLAVAADGLPWAGGLLRLELRALPPGRTALVWLAASRSAIGPYPLPLDLTVVGMPGCTLLQSADLALGVFNGNGTAALDVWVPDDGALPGVQVFAQGLVADPLANRIGVTLSNGAALRFGAR